MPNKDVKVTASASSVANENPSTEPVKKKRGRPPKNKDKSTGITNEGKDKILMDKSSNQNQNQSQSQNLVTPVINTNTVKNINNTSVANMSQQEFERLSMQQVQQRWAQVFTKYSSVMNAGEFQSLMYGGSSNYTRNDPFLNNQRVKQIVAEGRNIDANEVDQYIEDPVNNERPLQEISWALYYQSMLYSYLVKMDREVPLFHYYITPENIKPEDFTKESYKTEKSKVESIMKVLKPKSTYKDIIMQVENEGKCYYLPRISYDNKEAHFFTWQKLPGQFCKIVGFGSTERFIIMLDMSMFLNPMYDVAQFPPFIGEKWQQMIDGGIIKQDENTNRYSVVNKVKHAINDILEIDNEIWHYWYRLPQDMCFVFSADGSHPLAIPEYSGLLPDIADLTEYKLAQQTALSNAITSVLTAEVPYADNAVTGKDSTLAAAETVLGFTDLFESKVSKNIMGFFAPFENFKLLSLAEDIEPATTIVSNRIKDVVNTAGMSSLISLDTKPSVAAIKTAQLISESKAKYMVAQFENATNRVINESFDLNYQWKIHFVGYAFTFESDMKLMKEMILSGCKELLPRFLAGYDMTVEEYANIHHMVEALGIKIIKDELIFTLEEGRRTQLEALGVKNSVQLGDTSKSSVGRPKLDDSDITNDSTSDSRDQGGNVSEVKDAYADKFNKIKTFLSEYIGTDLDEDEVMNVLSEELENMT